jgi:hypothetical protein
VNESADFLMERPVGPDGKPAAVEQTIKVEFRLI